MISAVILEDETSAVGNLYNILKESSEINLKLRFNDEKEVFLILKKLKVDVIFVNMEIQTMDFAFKVRKVNSKVKIIFLTDYTKYSEDPSITYINKSVTRENLQKVIDGFKLKNEKNNDSRTWDIRVNCFGKFTVKNREGICAKWRTKKAEELFALLIDRKGRAVNRDKIIYILWKNFSETKAAVNLHTTVYNVKKALLAIGARDILIYNNGFYRINENKIKCDAWDVVGKIKKVNKQRFSIEEIGESIKIIEEGYFKENYFDWAEDKNKYFETMYLKLIFLRAMEYKQNSYFEEAIELLKKGLKVDGLNENLNKELIKLFIMSGEEIEAVKCYNHYKKELRKELGIKINSEVQEWIRN
ncbi:BTAD domain-containing putative transcriptional regulator [Clostridium felsineum]|uniref:BTAD domain-containing putative transcriptional regulator n=1 Tax=Clostridium felsineum TaxID=36839 RepID=UPI00098C2537|nr:BTAD domain-containing putative transcriptional regulator [Clostridium felsineum]URZ18715.1 hypothetical protein CLFE_048030 [Clostridium felsineum DSM 794]